MQIIAAIIGAVVGFIPFAFIGAFLGGKADEREKRDDRYSHFRPTAAAFGMELPPKQDSNEATAAVCLGILGAILGAVGGYFLGGAWEK